MKKNFLKIVFGVCIINTIIFPIEMLACRDKSNKIDIKGDFDNEASPFLLKVKL